MKRLIIALALSSIPACATRPPLTVRVELGPRPVVSFHLAGSFVETRLPCEAISPVREERGSHEN